MNKKIKEAIKVLKNGGIIIFPTDTSYGIGCRADDEEAIKKLFKIRKRPEKQAVPVLVSSISMAKEFFEKTPFEVDILMKKFWPGALTLVYEAKKDKLPELVRGGGNTVGIRMPNNSVILEIIKELRVPVLGPSANFHGSKTPFIKKEIDKKLIDLVDYFLEGDSENRLTSTVLDCTQIPWKVLRQGMIKI